MISDQQKQFLIKMFQMAIASGHMYPQFAACEAVEETGWGTTQAYLSANNVFGQKAPSALGRDDKVAILPTWEVFNGVKVRCTSIQMWMLQPSRASASQKSMVSHSRQASSMC